MCGEAMPRRHRAKGDRAGPVVWPLAQRGAKPEPRAQPNNTAAETHGEAKPRRTSGGEAAHPMAEAAAKGLKTSHQPLRSPENHIGKKVTRIWRRRERRVGVGDVSRRGLCERR